MDLSKNTFVLLSPDALRVGMYVHIDLGWMEHPFAHNQFRIANDKQLKDIQGLQCLQFCVIPAKSDAELFSVEVLNTVNDTSGIQSRAIYACRSMVLGEGFLNTMKQRHELADGSDYSEGSLNHQISCSVQIESLVNIYDNLNNSNNSMLSLTPHEAISMLFAQRKHPFEPDILFFSVHSLGLDCRHGAVA